MGKLAVVAVAGVVGVGSTIGIAAAQGGTPKAAPTVFTVVERAVTDTTADTGPKGDSLGDILAFANPIFSADNRTRLGSDNGSCVRTKVGAAYQCSWTVTLKGGSLVVEGPFYDAADSVLAITGGTGKWVKARGQMTLHARNAAGTAYDFTYSVTH